MKAHSAVALLAILLAASAVTGQEVRTREKPAGYGGVVASSLDLGEVINAGNVLNVEGGGDFLIGGRKLMQRQLLGKDGDGLDVVANITNNVYSRVGKHCPTNTTVDGPWVGVEKYNQTEWAVFGDVVHDAAVCRLEDDGQGRVMTTAQVALASDNAAKRGYIYGGAAQDFGPARANWESYGWSLFKLQNPPDDTYREDVKVQGLQLHVIGNVGTKHGASSECSIKGVSIAIYNSQQASPYNPNALNYTKTVWLNGTGETTLKWKTNVTAVLYLDIAQEADMYPRFSNGTYHWLRIKLFSDFGGSDETGQCFAFWGVSSKVSNDVSVKSRWQERVGGASGCSTTCVGAQQSGNNPAGSAITVFGGNTATQTVPDQYQTWWNCWNNGINTATGNTGRRCSTYRNSVNPAIPSADCLNAVTRAQFNDYNYAFSGHQGEPGVGTKKDKLVLVVVLSAARRPAARLATDSLLKTHPVPCRTLLGALGPSVLCLSDI